MKKLGKETGGRSVVVGIKITVGGIHGGWPNAMSCCGRRAVTSQVAETYNREDVIICGVRSATFGYRLIKLKALCLV